MKKTIIALMLSTGLSAHADCYIRSDITLSQMSVQGSPTDIQTISTPDVNGHKCVARYRVYADNQWHTMESSAVSPSQPEACARALTSKSYALLEITPKLVASDNQIVCSDLPDIRIRPVHQGELIWESETDMHSHPSQKGKYFTYKQARCRKFIERTAKDQNLIVYTGIICQNDTGPNSKWRVIDKY